MSKHTPGPWEYFGPNEDGIFGVKIGDAHEVSWDMEGTCSECFANMRLIAAAPDLLAVVDEYVNAVKTGDMTDIPYIYDRMLLALAKAKGE